MYKYNYEKGDMIGDIMFIERVWSDPKKREQWGRFKCHCGEEFITIIRSIRIGVTKSCGCIRYELMSKTNTRHLPIEYIGSVKKMPPFREQDIDRFWSKVALTANTEKCWIWTAGSNNRYGYFKMGKKTQFKCNRIAYFLHYGEDPKGMEVMHSCDNGKCCNPAHLSLGTHLDNMKDMANKNRAKNQHI